MMIRYENASASEYRVTAQFGPKGKPMNLGSLQQEDNAWFLDKDLIEACHMKYSRGEPGPSFEKFMDASDFLKTKLAEAH